MALDLQHALPLDDVERVENITREELYERFIKTKTPVVIKGLAEREGWAAWSKWTPDYFRDRFGDRPVMIVNKGVKSNESGHRAFYGGLVEMKMRDYLDAILDSDEDLRLAARHTVDIARELAADYNYPALGKSWSHNMLWLFFGSRGSHTPLHYDLGPFHVLHTCFLGKKTFCLFPNDQARQLHAAWKTVRSPVNPHAPDFDQFPRLRQVRGWRVDIDRGDTLYLPAAVWHDVKYHEASIALTQRFTEDARFIGGRVVGQLMMNRFSDTMQRMFPKAWPRWQERLA